MKIKAVICRPTLDCNADCSYCCAASYDRTRWDFETFKIVWDRLKTTIYSKAQWIWHGGEPLLLSPDFYRACAEYAWKTKPQISFSMQTNSLLYQKNRWYDVFVNIFNRSISTSYDPEGKYRTINGDPKTYTTLFFQKLHEMINDGFRPYIISTFSDENAHQALWFYELSQSYKENAFSIKLNYRNPVGRAKGLMPLISPRNYSQLLLDVWQRIIVDCPVFTVAPLTNMLDSVLGLKKGLCPRIRNCGGTFLNISPDGSLHTCSGFADLNNDQFCLGNVLALTINNDKMMISVSENDFLLALQQSPVMKRIKARRLNMPPECFQCPHFSECQGGCQKDCLLYNGDINSKYYYCESWKSVLHQIKTDISRGMADKFIQQKHPFINAEKLHGIYEARKKPVDKRR